MNWFSLFAMLLLVTQASAPIPRQASNRPTASSTQSNGQSKGNNAPPAPSMAFVQPVTAPESQDTNEGHTEDNATRAIIVRELPTVTIAKGGFDWAILANYLLVVVGFGGIGVALWTLCFIRRQVEEMTLQRGVMQQTLLSIDKQATLMEKQTEILKQSVVATEKSAEAALLSAKALMNTERPWLVIGVEQSNNTETGDLPLFVFTCLNQGNTPAAIKRIDANYRIVADPFDLPVPMTDKDVNPRVLPEHTFIVHKDSFEILPHICPDSILFDRRNGMQKSPTEFLMFFGRVVYHDVFPSWGTGREPHETRWCYWYNESDGILIPTGPDEYNSHT